VSACNSAPPAGFRGTRLTSKVKTGSGERDGTTIPPLTRDHMPAWHTQGTHALRLRLPRSTQPALTT